MDIKTIRERLEAYIKVDISLDLKSFPDNQKQIIENLVAAGKVADEIFWRQSSHDALIVREQYKDLAGPVMDYIKKNILSLKNVKQIYWVFMPFRILLMFFL